MNLRNLMILLLTALVLLSLNADPVSSPMPSDNAYGIESSKLYPGSLVLELLAIAEDEAAEAVKSAYADGYKAGRIDGAAIWKKEYDSLQKAYDKLNHDYKNLQKLSTITLIGFTTLVLGSRFIGGR